MPAKDDNDDDIPVGGGVAVDAESAPGTDDDMPALGAVSVGADDGALGADGALESGDTNVPFLHVVVLAAGF